MPKIEYAIEVSDLRKSYGNVAVLNGVNLRVRRGTVFALLGPNGAGKTTIIRILATLLKQEAGTVKVFGHDTFHEVTEVRRRMSLTGQFAAIDNDLTGRENLIVIARLQGYSHSEAKVRANELLDAFSLAAAADRPAKRYSGGMLRRLDIAASIVVTPDLIFLDEPTTGLDPRSRNQIWDIVRAMVEVGTTVMLTTQYLEEADNLADRIAVIDHGAIIAEGTSGELKASIGSGVLHVRLEKAKDRTRAEQLLGELLDVPVLLGSDPVALSAKVSDVKRAARALLALEKSGIMAEHFSLGQPSLDEVFLSLTGKTANLNKEDIA